MTEHQSTLFDSKPLSRRDDPATSHDAAEQLVESGQLPRMCQLALDVLRAREGSTASELDEASGLREGSIRKRLGDLRRRGLAYVDGVKVCRVTGRNAQRWWITGD